MRIIYLSYENSCPLPESIVVNINQIRQKGLKRLVDECKTFKPDLIIEREFNDGKAKYDEFLKHFDCIKAFWCIDSHISLPKYLTYAQNFDYIFLAVSENVGRFKRSFWLPLYFPGNRMEVQKEFTYDLSFVGRCNSFHSNRILYLSELEQRYDIRIFKDCWKDMPVIMNTSRLSFNCSIDSKDMNFRVFEALGYGSNLITDCVRDINKLGNLGERINTFKNSNQLFSIIDNFQDNYQRRIENQEWIFEKHRLVNRMNELIEMIKTGKQYEYQTTDIGH